MTVALKKYVDPDVVGGNANGWDLANSYSTLNAAMSAEKVNCSNLNGAVVSSITAFTVANVVINFSPSGAAAKFKSLVGSDIIYELTSGVPAVGDTITPASGSGSAYIDSITDTSGGTISFMCSTTSGSTDTTALNYNSTDYPTTAINKVIISGDYISTLPEPSQYHLNVAGARSMQLSMSYVDVFNIQVTCNDAGQRGLYFSGSGHINIDACRVALDQTSNGNYIRGVLLSGTGTGKLTNSVISGFRRASNDYAGLYVAGSVVLDTYNNVIEGCYRCVWHGTSGANTIKNTVLEGTNVSGGSGTGLLTIDYCATRTGTGTNPITIGDIYLDHMFTGYLAGDYSLSLASSLLGAGVGYNTDTLVPLKDAEGNTRNTAISDIGISYNSNYDFDLLDPRILYDFNESSGLVVNNVGGLAEWNGVIGEKLVQTDQSVATGTWQGYATNGVDNYVSGNQILKKFNSDYSTTLVTNSAPFGTDYPTPEPDRIGGIQYYNSKIYASMTNSGNSSAEYIGIYSSVDLTFIDYIDLAPVGHWIAAITIDVANSEIVVFGYSDGFSIKYYDLVTHAYKRTTNLPYRFNCNGAFHDSVTNTFFAISAKSAGGVTDCILQLDLAGNRLANYVVPTTTEPEGLFLDSGGFRYNSFPDERIFTATYPTAPSRTVGKLNLNSKYHVQVAQIIPEEFSMVFGITPNSFIAGNSIFGTSVSSTLWISEIDAAGNIRFLIGDNAVSYLLPSATTEYEIGITIVPNGANYDVNLYVDKTLRDTKTQIAASLVTGNADKVRDFALGSADFSTNDSTATFHYFAFYHYELSQAQITAFTPPSSTTVITGSGVHQAEGAVSNGYGSRSITGLGSPQSLMAISVGIATRVITGLGTAQASNATSVGTVERVTVGTGSHQAENATSIGWVVSPITGSGAHQSVVALSSGIGERGIIGLGVHKAAAALSIGTNVPYVAPLIVRPQTYHNNRVMLATLRESIGKCGTKPIALSSLYGIEIITTGVVEALVIRLYGAISASNMEVLLTYDVIANGKLLYLSNLGVSALEVEIVSISGGGSVSIVVFAQT